MKRILGCEAIRAIEHESFDLDPPLMERAGQAAAQDALALLSGRTGSVLVLAGPGNNGGDAFVLARLLLEQGVCVHLVCLAEPERLPTDARAACLAWLSAGGKIAQDFAQEAWALAVDGLFGIGLSRPLDGLYAAWIARLNTLNCPVLALDIPSGLDAESGRCLGPCVRASHTVSFIALKPGLLTLDGPDVCGEIRVHDLGLEVSPEAGGALLSPEAFAHCLKPRLRNVHKGCFGAAGVIGGAAGMVGAGLLAARAALHLGAGKVFLGLLDEALAVDPLFPEIMIRPAAELFALSTALALGPGLGKSADAADLLASSCEFTGPLLLDADALNLLAENSSLQADFAARSFPLILTPHPAEAARLLGTTVQAIQADRILSAKMLADRFNACIVLKGCGAVIAPPDGRWFINTSGHGGMATAGMGDVLSGLVLALLAQGWGAGEALMAGVHLHGLAAERLVLRGVGPVGLCAGETLISMRSIFNELMSIKLTR